MLLHVWFIWLIIGINHKSYALGDWVFWRKANVQSTNVSKELPALCYRERKDVSDQRKVIGRWINGSYSYTGTFSKEHDIQEWWLNACPAQMVKQSCYHRDIHLLRGHGYSSFSKIYQLDNCILDSFVPTQFLELMVNRSLNLCCDSTSMQLFVMLVCSLHNVTEVNYDNLKWTKLAIFDRKDCIDESGVHCLLTSSDVFYPKFNFRISYRGTHLLRINQHRHKDENLSDYMENFPILSSRDVLLLNQGTHFQPNPTDLQALSRYVERIVNAYTALSPEQKFLLIWRETWAQHFNSLFNPSFPIGYFSPGNPYPCAPYDNLEKARDQDFRNKIPNKIIGKANIPILRLYYPSALAAEQHIGVQKRKDEPNSFDCTHYCDNSGFLYFARDLLFNALQVLLLPVNN